MTPEVERLNEIYRASIESRLLLKVLKEAHIDLDGLFKGRLLPYQTAGANFIYRGRRSLLGDPVGFGKTPMSIAAALMALKESKVDFVIVVAPANLCPKWLKEIEKFSTLQGIDMKKAGNRIRTYKKFITTDIRNVFFFVTSYAAISKDILEKDPVKDRMIIRKNGLIPLIKDSNSRVCTIFDEVQRCKHRGSIRSRASKILANNSRHVYALSATYVEGRLKELFSVFETFQPRVLGSCKVFSNKFIIENEWGVTIGHRHLPQVKQMIDPYVIRRFVEDVGIQMPDEIYQEYWISLTSTQKALYRGIIDDHLERLNASTNRLVEMMKERQCCLSTELINPEIRESPKIQVVKDIIESLEKDAKVLIFCFFHKEAPMIDIIVRELDKWFAEQQDPSRILMLKGGMSAQRMENIRNEFHEDPDAKILVTSDVSREGHDIVAGRHLINFDLLWNPAYMRQRAGRLIRPSFIQKAKQVVIHTIITRNTIEQYMWDVVLTNKKGVMKKVMDGGREEKRVTRMEAIQILENYRG